MPDSGIFFHQSAADNLSGAIRFYNFESGDDSTIVDLDKPTTNGVSAAADGRWLIYNQEHMAGSDLMLVDGFE